METQHPLGWTEKPKENSVHSMERNFSQSRKRSHDAYATLLELYCCGEEKNQTTLFLQHCFLKFSSKKHYMVNSVEFNLSSSQDHKLGQPCQELMQFVSNPNSRCQSTVVFPWSLDLLYCLFIGPCIAVLGAGKTLLPPQKQQFDLKPRRLRDWGPSFPLQVWSY